MAWRRFLAQNNRHLGSIITFSFARCRNYLAVFALAAIVSACGGDGGSSSSPAKLPVTGPAAPTTALKLSSAEYAQTHILPEAGLKWTLAKDTASLKLVGKRDTLMLVTLDVADASNPVVNGVANGVALGKLALNPPSALPPTEAGGAPYKAGLYSVVLPASWLVKGLSLTVSADNYLASAPSAPVIGAASVIDLNIVPFYLFGANDSNTQSLAAVQAPTAATRNDIYDKWPVSEIKVKPFAGGRIDFPTVVVAPRADANNVRQPAYALANLDQQRDGYAAMSSVLDLMGLMRHANGEEATNNLYYGPMLTLNAAGKFANLGGGLGGGGGGVGDTAYSGIFIHEMGHAYGLPHANDGYLDGKYPYAGGSTKGSAWGYDQNAKRFLNLLVDKSAMTFATCARTNQTTASGQCYKQDIMQSGAEDKTAGHSYGAFSDFNVAKIQQWFEGIASTDAAGKRVFSGGVLFPDSSFASGYARWDSLASSLTEHVPALTKGGLYGINDDLPVTKNVPVYTIMGAYSQAGSPGASTIYPPVKYTGNLIKTFDPASAQDIADFTIDTGKYYWYCKGSGCDYTIRVTYADGSVIYRALKGSFRPWFTPTAAFPASASAPLDSNSFRTWAINVPADKNISRIELLDTPMVWKGLPANPAVLLSRAG